LQVADFRNQGLRWWRGDLAGIRLTAGRRETVREGSSPQGRDAARPGEPVAQKKKVTGE
jgi:hypothetical protein